MTHKVNKNNFTTQNYKTGQVVTEEAYFLCITKGIYLYSFDKILISQGVPWH
jgi:hypothetical protein